MERSDVFNTSKGVQTTHFCIHEVDFARRSLKTPCEQHIDRLLATELFR